MFPLLCSLILYQYISEHQSISGDDVVDYQLPARFADLASILQSIGMVDEACLVLSLVIVTEMPRCYSLQHSGTWSELDCLNFFAARSKNVILPVASQPEATKLAKSSIRRLVNIFGDSEKQTNNTGTVRFERRAPKELKISSALYLLKESICSGLPIVDLFAKACGIEFHLGQLLGAVFQGSQSLAESPGKKLNSSFSKPAMLLADVLVEFGTMIKKVVRKEDPDEDDSILNDLLQQYQVLVVQINDLVPDFVSDPVFPSSNSTILGMFKMVASTSVLPCQNFYDEFMQKLKVEFSECGTHRIARELAEESLQNFETANSGIMSGAWVSISTSLRASVYQYCRILQSWRLPEESMVTNDLKLLYLCRHSAEIAEQTTGNTTGLDRFLKQSIIWTLIHFQNILECRGDSLQATVVALWALSLENESDADENDWLRSITMSSWINGGSLTRALDLSVEESSTNLPSLSPNSIAWIAIYERLLNEIRLDLSRSNCILGNYCYPYEKLVKIKSEVSNIDSGKSETIFLLSQWLLSTIELTHSEIAASAGLFSQALKHSQQCIRHCQTLMKSTFLFEPDAPFWVLAACSTLFGRARQRYTESLGRKSKIYYLIGDYRKATAAIETFAGFLGIDVSTREKDRRNKLQHLISSFTTGASAHQRKYLRLNVKQQCFSSAYDLVARNFSSSTLEGLSEKLFHGPQEVLCTPPEIETLQDLLSGK